MSDDNDLTYFGVTVTGEKPKLIPNLKARIAELQKENADLKKQVERAYKEGYQDYAHFIADTTVDQAEMDDTWTDSTAYRALKEKRT